MAERHTIEFREMGVNILSDAERATITLQFDQSCGGGGGRFAVDQTLKAIRGRFGDAVGSRLKRLCADEPNPLVLGSPGRTHPDYPDVVNLEIGVKPGVSMETALSCLLDFLRRQPGYRHTYGAPIDRDSAPSSRRNNTDDPAAKAADVLRRLFEQRKRRRP
jgi:hypothetical protein